MNKENEDTGEKRAKHLNRHFMKTGYLND
jgi:hypothetical protein